MTRDRVDWLGCDARQCRNEISGPARRLTETARAAGWVRQLKQVWMDEDDGGEVWADLCPAHASESYLRWADEYAAAYGTGPWEAALAGARARVSADVAAAPSRPGNRYRVDIEPADAEPVTVLTAAQLLLSGWLLLPGLAEIGPETAETARSWRYGAGDTILPGPALGQVGVAERDVLEQIRTAAAEDTRRRWETCVVRVLDDRPR